MSELMYENCIESVSNWAKNQTIEDMHFSSISEAELLYGAEILPEGQRKQSLLAEIKNLLDIDLQGRVFSFDRLAAREYADIVAGRRAMGRPVSTADGQIAAIARAMKLTLATGNVRDFEHVGLDIVNPWETG